MSGSGRDYVISEGRHFKRNSKSRHFMRGMEGVFLVTLYCRVIF
jgi:hypothetical protein